MKFFSGLFWVGQKTIDLGLADGIGSIFDVIQKKFGKKAKVKFIDQKKIFYSKKIIFIFNRYR